MATSRAIALLLMLLVARAAGAAGLGVAWDASSEAGVTGYRVYVGTEPGQRTQFFDVGPFQTTFVYAGAVEGREYFFSVATRIGGLVGPPSGEVSGSISNALSVQPQPDPLRTPGARVEATVSGSSVSEVASGLGPVSSLAIAPNGVGLFIEGRLRVRILAPAGLVPEPALEAADGEEYLSLSLHPDFSANGIAYLLVETMLPGGDVDRRVVRHRLAGAALGEPASIITGLPAVQGASHLAIARSGHIFVAQAGSVLRFTLEGTVPRDQPSGSPRWSTSDLHPEAALWDEARAGLWVVGRAASADLVARFVRNGVALQAVPLSAAGHVEGVSVAAVSGRVHVQVVSNGAVTSTDVEDGSLRAVDTGQLRNVVGWMPGSTGDSYIVIAHDTDPGSSSLLHLTPDRARLDAAR